MGLTTRTTTPTGPTTATKSRAEGAAALGRCVDPVAVEDFLSGYWEQRPLVIQRHEPERFHDLLSPADVERLICSRALRYPAFRLVRDGSKLEPESYTNDLSWSPVPFSGTIDVERVLAEFEAGATIVLQALHHNWLPLARFSRGLEAALGHPVQANAYLTPRSAQGLAVHHDTHDVLVLQIAGQKHWRVYEPVLELPLPNQRYSQELGAPGKPVEDLILGPGDTMYLPRGWLHDALTTDSESLHLTVGVKVYTWLDAVKAAVEECSEELDFRRSVPDEGEMRADLVELLERRLTPAEVARRRRERFVRTRRPIRDGQLGQLRALARLTLQTPVERRATVIAELEFPALTFEGKALAFPPHVQDEVEFAFSVEEPFTASELPGDLDEEGRLVFVRRLVREGFLVQA
jgi:bifunctional lysine-specific demethylase and histidyl-hydroxylase NO66